jgi:hypothetical protein
MLFCVLASLLVPGVASANTAAGAETRVWAFDLQIPTPVGVERPLSLELHKGCEPTYDDPASDSLLAARGGVKAIKGLQKQLDKHLKRLEDYKANPDKFDNKGFLKGASPERRQQIIDGRIRSLERQIENFRNQINQAGGGG